MNGGTPSPRDPKTTTPGVESSLQGVYRDDIVSWATPIALVFPWEGIQHFAEWYHHPAREKRCPPLGAAGHRTCALVLSALHMALCHPESFILVIVSDHNHRLFAERLLTQMVERAWVRPWFVTIVMDSAGLRLHSSNMSTILVRSVEGEDTLADVRGLECDAILVEDETATLSLETVQTVLLPMLIKRTHQETGTDPLRRCWLFY